MTCAHIFKLIRMGCFIRFVWNRVFQQDDKRTVSPTKAHRFCRNPRYSNHFFRVDKGFVAQIADVIGGRTVALNEEQQEEASKTVPLEVVQGVKHHAGECGTRIEEPTWW